MTPAAWHDAPTCPGRWVNSKGRSVDIVDPAKDIIGLDLTVRWYGPLPEDTK